MKILHVDEQASWRGGEAQASWLMQGLVEYGHEVGLAGRPGTLYTTDAHGGIEVDRIELPLRSEIDYPSMRRLGRIVRERGYDIVHAHSSHAHTFAAAAARISGTAKSVISKRLDRAPRSSFLNRWKYNMPDMFVPVSKVVGDVLLDYGIPPEKVKLVYDCIRPDLLDVEPLDRAELGVGDDDIVLFSAGALVDQKDFPNLFKAMPFFMDEFRQVRILIAGEGRDQAMLERMLADMGYADVVTFLGQRSDVARIMRTADLYVSSSHTEGLGTSVLEALACELPIVATDAGGVREMVLDGKTGLLVPKRDPEALGRAIGESLRNADKRREMVANGLAHINANFLPNHMTEGFIEVYEALLRS